MLKPLTKTDYRELFCHALRNSPLKQCHGMFGWDMADEATVPEQACALGIAVLAQVIDAGVYYGPGSCGNRLGISPDEIAEKNDAGWTFAQIADWIEALPC